MHPLALVGIGVAAVVVGLLVARLHPAPTLVGAALLVGALTPTARVHDALVARERAAQVAGRASPGDDLAARASRPVVWRVAAAAADTAWKIGPALLFAGIVAEGMVRSGGADRIVGAALALFGPGRSAAALTASSFLLGIPVFFELVFLLLLPLARAVHARTGRGYLLHVLAIVAGGTMTHTLVPPTPGPLFVASALQVPIGTMMLVGSAVAAVAATAGMLYARALVRRVDVPVRDVAGGVVPLSARRPPLTLALAVLVLPLVLVIAQTVPASVALGATAVLALALVWRYGDGTSGVVVSLRRGLRAGAAALLVIAAGGAFGDSLRATDVGSLLAAHAGSGFGLILVAFAVTMAVRTAQGSATVAMMTGAFLIAGVASAAPLPFHPVYLALAIGCGAKNFAWMNDAGFWVMSKTAGLTVGETLRTVSTMNLVLGGAGLGAVLLGAWLFPLR